MQSIASGAIAVAAWEHQVVERKEKDTALAVSRESSDSRPDGKPGEQTRRDERAGALRRAAAFLELLPGCGPVGLGCGRQVDDQQHRGQPGNNEQSIHRTDLGNLFGFFLRAGKG